MSPRCKCFSYLDRTSTTDLVEVLHESLEHLRTALLKTSSFFSLIVGNTWLSEKIPRATPLPLFESSFHRTCQTENCSKSPNQTTRCPRSTCITVSSLPSQYERTPFFDGIIERGLRGGTRFSIDDVTNDEKAKLGIVLDQASGRYYLSTYGSPKSRRGSSRRGSQTSSDGDAIEQGHAVIKEVEETLAAEIEAAGDPAEVVLLKKYVEPSNARGSRLVHFTVCIRKRGGSSGSSVGQSEREKGGGVGPSTTQAADAGAGKTAAVAARRRTSIASVTSQEAACQGAEGMSPRQHSRGQDLAAGAAVAAHQKSRVRHISTAAGQGSSEFPPAQHDAPKRRKCLTSTLFGSEARAGTPKLEADAQVSHTSGEDGMAKFNGSRSHGVGGESTTTSRVPGRMSIASQYSSGLSAPHYGSGVNRQPSGLTSSNPVVSSWSEAFQQQRAAAALSGAAVSGNGQGHLSHSSGGSERSSGMVMSSCPQPPLSSWHSTRPPMRSDDFASQGGLSSTGRRGGDSSAGDGAAPTCGLGLLSSLTQQQQHIPSLTPFSSLRTATGTGSIGRMSPPSSLFPCEQHGGVTISGLNAYSTNVRQSHMTSSNLHGGATAPLWGSTRISGAVDEEDIDFLSAFF